MTDKQIIIDGVDVAKCRCFTSEWDFNNCGHICKGTECKYKRLWYKKQLKRKEQECNKLYIQLKSDEEYHKEEENTLRKIIKNKEKRNIELYKENNKLQQTLTEIKEIVEPYDMTIKKICGNCKKYDDCHSCCYKDINCYKYTSSKTVACEEFTYLDELVPNIIAINILQKIRECEVENDT